MTQDREVAIESSHLALAIAASAILLLAGCVTGPPRTETIATGKTSFTHVSARDPAARYFRCVSDAALPLARVPDTAGHIARMSAKRCQDLLDTVTQGLRQENAGVPFAEQYAAAYGESLKKRVIRDVTKAVAHNKTR